MCGIVGLFAKNKLFEAELGRFFAPMLIEMTDRGPDSTGVAIYRNRLTGGEIKITLLATDPAFDWQEFESKIRSKVPSAIKCEIIDTHAVLTLRTPLKEFTSWIRENYPALRINSSGRAIEIYKDLGLPVDFIKRFGVEQFTGSHALGHTRMATESAVTVEHSHPFSTGLDLCLVHNGSLSNHNRLREQLQANGIEFQTDNDSEVAAGYLMWQLHQGASLEEALNSAIRDLDGFYTFAVGTRNGFAVLRDPFACKPAVLAESEDWVAMASEFRAIAQLPGAEHATVWEPAPATVYSWGKE